MATAIKANGRGKAFSGREPADYSRLDRVDPLPARAYDLLRGIAKEAQKRGQAGFQVRKASLSEDGGVRGGYTVPLGYSNALFNSIAEHSIIEPRAQIVPMHTAECVCPTVGGTTNSGTAGVSWFLGNMQFLWGDGGYNLSETEPQFSQVSLKAWNLYGYCVCSNQFVEDMGEEGELALMRLFGRAAAWYKDYAFFQGTGAASLMPLGVINAPCAIPVARAGGNAIVIADINNMSDRLLPSGWATAIWVCNPKCLTQVTAISQFYINNSYHETTIDAVGNLLGRPLYISEKLPTLGSTGDLMLIDPSLYVVGNRMEVDVQASPHPNFLNNQTVFRVWLRCDGKCLMSFAPKMADNVTTVSSVVLLHS
jgi:HK97 family phage major capsid protein